MSKTRLFVEFLRHYFHPYRKTFWIVLIIIFIETFRFDILENDRSLLVPIFL
jgi:hypothetical protein